MDYKLKMALWFEVKQITNQISKYFQIKYYAATFKPTQIKSLNQITTFWFVSSIWITPDLNTTMQNSDAQLIDD